MNKYQEALDYIESIVIDEDVLRIFDSPNYPPLIKNHIKLLQELVDQTKTPTKEEIIKEWKELGFDYNEENDCGKKLIMLERVDLKYTICIETETKEFGVYYDRFFTFEEYKLLTKTFKMLGWE